MLIVDSAESIIQKRIRQDEYIQFWPQGWSMYWGKWGGCCGDGRMESSWVVLVLPLFFITPGKRAILFPFVNTILRIHCQNMSFFEQFIREA